jgi:hypothetical protein
MLYDSIVAWKRSGLVTMRRRARGPPCPLASVHPQSSRERAERVVKRRRFTPQW